MKTKVMIVDDQFISRQLFEMYLKLFFHFPLILYLTWKPVASFTFVYLTLNCFLPLISLNAGTFKVNFGIALPNSTITPQAQTLLPVLPAAKYVAGLPA